MEIRLNNAGVTKIGNFELLIQAVIMFLVIFNPPIISFNSIHIIAAASWVYLTLSFSSLNRYINTHRLIIVVVVLCMLGAYQLIVALLANNNLVIVSNYIFWVFEVIPYGVALTVRYKKAGYRFNNLLNVIIIACMMQSAMAIAALVIPSVKAFFIQKIIDYGYSDVHERLSLYRNYGFADSLTFASSIVQAIIASISLFYYVRTKRKVYLIAYVVGAFAAILNTRTAIVVLLVGLLALILTIRGFRELVRTIGVLILLIIALVIGLSILKKYNEWTYYWVIEGVTELITFVSKDSGSYGAYFTYVSSSSSTPLPDGILILTGLGTEIMHVEANGVQSDIGYINDIWRIGLIVSCFIYAMYIWLLNCFRKTDEIDNSTGNFLFFFLLFSAALINIKGYYFVYNDVTTLIWILFIFCCCQRYSAIVEVAHD